MNDQDLAKFLARLSGAFLLFAPQQVEISPAGEKEIRVGRINNPAEIDWSGEMPANTWKSVFLPAREKLFDLIESRDLGGRSRSLGVRAGSLTETQTDYPAIACLAVNVLDLKAITLLDQVFGSDSYYQKRRRRTLVVGYSAYWPDDYQKYKVFSHDWEENILEHVNFDIFLTRLGKPRSGKIKVYSGSAKGQAILEKLGISDYKNIAFSGAVAETGPDKKILALKNKVSQSRDKKIWSDLDKICLACGKCAVVCPTCFCFDLVDNLDAENAGRERRQTTCFYNDFSRVAGSTANGQKDLDTVKAKIYFWYTHKFVRIPHQYGLPGCVSCGRCVKVCPVKIDIFKNIKRLMET